MAHIFRLLPWPSISLATENNKCRKKNNNSHVRLSNTTGGELCRVLTAQNRHTEDWRISTHTHTQQEMDETQLDRGQRFVQADTFLFFFISNQLNCFGRGHSISFFFGRPILWLRTNTHTMAKSDGEKRKKRKIDASNTAIHQNARDVVCRAVFHLCVCLLLSYPFGCSKNAFLFFFLSSPSIHPSLSFCVCVCFIYRQRSLTGLYASFYRNSCTDTANTSTYKKQTNFLVASTCK